MSITKEFHIHQDIFTAMRQPEILEKLRVTVSAERIREEVFKMMKAGTVKTLEFFREIEDIIPGFLDLVFGRGLWLKPTFEA